MCLPKMSKRDIIIDINKSDLNNNRFTTSNNLLKILVLPALTGIVKTYLARPVFRKT